ncbi:MAG TPA: hypothetical protein VFO54_03145 [Chryseosolibacter sp.]|nr:hypothetical protein [Chryseosolibacter sp.]
MMRILMAISLSALTLACAHKDAGKGLAKLSGRNKSAEILLPAADQSVLDSTFYIGYVDYFPETKEFYTALFYKDGYEYPDEDLLESKLDSVILSDDDWGRERLPMEEARKWLMLSGMDTLCIYNRSHKLISRSSLRRIEYLWNGLESYFVAVYGSDGKLDEQTEELYGISAHYSSLLRPSFTSEEFADAHLNDYVVKKLNVSRALDWDIRHYRTAPPETTYSVISSYTMQTNEAFSYLTSLEKNTVQILNKEVNNYHFLNILPLPIKTHGRPLLLISAGYPSSDVLWDYLAGYDGKSYETVDFNRVHVKTVEP